MVHSTDINIHQLQLTVYHFYLLVCGSFKIQCAKTTNTVSLSSNFLTAPYLSLPLKLTFSLETIATNQVWQFFLIMTVFRNGLYKGL